MHTAIRVLAVCASLCFICACVSRDDDFPCKDRARKVFQKDTTEAQNKEFEKIEDIEMQYCVYMYGLKVIHPPVIMADSIAKNPLIVPLLKKKLQEPADDSEIWALCDIITYLKIMNRYPVERDKELMDLLNSAISKVKNKDIKKAIIDMLVHASLTMH